MRMFVTFSLYEKALIQRPECYCQKGWVNLHVRVESSLSLLGDGSLRPSLLSGVREGGQKKFSKPMRVSAQASDLVGMAGEQTVLEGERNAQS